MNEPGQHARTEPSAAKPDRGTSHPHPRRPRVADDLAGRGRTALTPDKAMRARDLDRPTAEELERAETELPVVRRNWTPPT